MFYRKTQQTGLLSGAASVPGLQSLGARFQQRKNAETLRVPLQIWVGALPRGWQEADWDELVHAWIAEAALPHDPPILRLSPHFADEVTYLLSVFGPKLARFFVIEMVRIHRSLGGGELRVWKKIRIFEKKCCAKI